MTKREYHRLINYYFYDYINKNNSQYDIDSSEGYGLIYLIPKNGNNDDIIEYHQSRHTLCIYNWSNKDTKNTLIIIEKELKKIISYVDFLYKQSIKLK